MSRHPSLPIVKRVAIAAIVGSTCGSVAALWSVRHESNRAPVVQTPRAVPGSSSSSPAPIQHAASGSSMQHDTQTVAPPVPAVPAAAKSDASAAPAAKAPASVAALPSAGVDEKDVLSRARALAQRADVKALVALRESIVRRAEENGETGSAASKQQLDEFDRYLGEARLRRLKLDAEEFKHAEAAGSRPR
jgi:hypothetical protein